MGVIAALLDHMSAADAAATFSASKRGREAADRHPQFENYLARTIAAASKIRKGPESIHVDFGKRRTAGKTVTEDESGFIIENPQYIQPEGVRWLWYPYVPAGKITIIASDPGVGKSTIAVDLAARISLGRAMPGSSERLVTGYSLIASAEDASDDTITPRLIAAGADRARIGIMREVRVDGKLCYFSLPRDLESLRKLIIGRGARLLVIDPINAFLSKETSSHVDQDVRLGPRAVGKSGRGNWLRDPDRHAPDQERGDCDAVPRRRLDWIRRGSSIRSRREGNGGRRRGGKDTTGAVLTEAESEQETASPQIPHRDLSNSHRVRRRDRGLENKVGRNMRLRSTESTARRRTGRN